MKIKHNFVRTGCTLSGQILETIFEEGEERGDCEQKYSADRWFRICSAASPDIQYKCLYVWGSTIGHDNNIISYTYSSEQEAEKALDHINEFTVQEEVEAKDNILVPGTEVYVSDESDEVAQSSKSKRVLIIDLGKKYCRRYICVRDDIRDDWEYYYHAVPVPPAPQKTKREVMMTDEEYEAFISKK